jgi:hypothetical protein
MTMSKFKMELYMTPTGVVATYDWQTEQDFQRAQAFLLDLLGPGGRSGIHSGEPEFYYVETEQQQEAFHDFARKWRRPSS